MNMMDDNPLPGARILTDDDDYDSDVVTVGSNKATVDRRTNDTNNILLNKHFINNVPINVTRNIVRYLDEVFGSLMRRLSEIDEVKAFKHMGNIVDSILRYNNIHFKTINVRDVQQEFNMPEPLWYTFDLETLNLFVSHNWYESYVAINTNVPVLWQCGNIPLDKFNFTEQDPIVGPLDMAKIKCIMACDHVAQHIIHDYTNNREQLSHTDIHDSWTTNGATLHAMLDLTIYVNPEVSQNHRDPYESNNSTGGVGIWSLF